MKFCNIFIVVVFMGATLLNTSVFAADIEAGKAKAAICAGCHGTDGIARMNPMYPNLKGQNAAYTLAQLKAFKSGERKNTVMKSMAQMLTEQDMKNIAAYYQSLGND